MKLTCTRLLVLFLLLVFAGCGGIDDPTRSIDFVPLRSIEITSQNAQVAAGTANRFTAIGHYGGSENYQFTRNITSQVTWVSSDPSVLSFSIDPASAGLATAGVAGTVQVAATMATIHGELLFTVSDAAITSLTIPAPASATLFAGLTLQLQATGKFSDGSSQDLTDNVTWRSSDATVATVTTTVPGAGLVKAVAPGAANITAASGNLSATQAITVSAVKLASIAVTSSAGSSTLAKGTTMQLIATGTYTDKSSNVITSGLTWAVSDLAIATIDQSSGIISGVGAGSATVTVKQGDITSPAFQVTVSTATLDKLAIAPTDAIIAVGKTKSLTATGTFSDSTTQEVTRDVVWISGNSTVATVSQSTGEQGTVKGIAAGTASITAGSSNIPTTRKSPVSTSVTVTVQ